MFRQISECVGVFGTCTMSCMGACVHEALEQFSMGCLQCFEVAADCSKHHCWEECAVHGRQSDTCVACSRKFCGGQDDSTAFITFFTTAIQSEGCRSEFR